MNLLRLNRWRTLANRGLTYLIALSLGFNLVACGTPELSESTTPSPSVPEPTQSITEVSPPVAIGKLHQALDQYQPQVSIISPQPDKVLQDNTINVKLDVQNLPIFQDDTLGLGPHLQVILDNQPTQAIYDLEQPLVFENLEPGTHTLRVFAAYPWDESFKNEGAYAQTQFHLFTRTPRNNPDLAQPLLTLNRPTGTYGTEPILLDFYLANPPVNPVNSEDDVEENVDWQIQMTLNGERFLIDQWQPIYIKGVKAGKNWIQIQYLDQQGQPLNNVYNNTAKVFSYDPNLTNSLSQLFRGELSASQLQAIVDPDYVKEISIPVADTEEVEEPIEPSLPEDDSLEDSELLPRESDIEERILSPIEGTLEETLEPTSTETEILEESPSLTEPVAQESVEPTTAEENNLEAAESVVEESIENTAVEADILETAEPVREEWVDQTPIQTEIFEESPSVSEPVAEELVTLEADILETAEPVREEWVDQTTVETEIFEESPSVSEPVAEELVTLEADILETAEPVREEWVDQTTVETDILEESTSDLEAIAEELVNLEADILETAEPVREEWLDQTTVETEETSEIPMVAEEPILEEKIEATVTQKETRELPKEMINPIDKASEVVLENPEEPQSEQFKVKKWFNAILKRIKLPY